MALFRRVHTRRNNAMLLRLLTLRRRLTWALQILNRIPIKDDTVVEN